LPSAAFAVAFRLRGDAASAAAGSSSAHDPRALDAPALLDGGDTVLCQFRGNNAQNENLSSSADTDQAALLT
jgi:hypothetical protein